MSSAVLSASSVVLCVTACLLVAAPAQAQISGTPAPGYRQNAGMPASAVPAPLREVGFDQRVGERIPLDAGFRDEQGRAIRLGDYFGSKPVLLAFVYYDCPMLCTQVLSAMTAALGLLSLEAGGDFEVVVVSFDPKETPGLAAARRSTVVERYGRPGAGAGFHFLTGEPASIERVTSAAGFRYVWDEETQQFAHPAGLIVLTPDGRPARYLFGLEYGARDLRLALVEASEGRVGSVVDSILLYCYHYDPMRGRYGLVVMRALRLAGAATVVAIGSFIVVMVRRERSASRRAGG